MASFAKYICFYLLSSFKYTSNNKLLPTLGKVMALFYIAAIMVLFSACTKSSSGSPLYDAAEQGNLEKVQELVAKGANINSPCKYGSAPLHVAAGEGHLMIVRYLVDHGALVNVATSDGITPLHDAAGEGRLDVVRYLISAGANYTAKDFYGWTPLEWAKYGKPLCIQTDKGFERADPPYFCYKEQEERCHQVFTYLEGLKTTTPSALASNVISENSVGEPPLTSSLLGENQYKRYDDGKVTYEYPAGWAPFDPPGVLEMKQQMNSELHEYNRIVKELQMFMSPKGEAAFIFSKIKLSNQISSQTLLRERQDVHRNALKVGFLKKINTLSTKDINSLHAVIEDVERNDGQRASTAKILVGGLFVYEITVAVSDKDNYMKYIPYFEHALSTFSIVR